MFCCCCCAGLKRRKINDVMLCGFGGFEKRGWLRCGSWGGGGGGEDETRLLFINIYYGLVFIVVEVHHQS